MCVRSCRRSRCRRWCCTPPPTKQSRSPTAGLAEHIPRARYIEYSGGDHRPWDEENVDRLLGDIEEFITGRREAHPEPEVGRVLATILFTNIVNSTKQLAVIGDKRWRELLDQHDALARRPC